MFEYKQEQKPDRPALALHYAVHMASQQVPSWGDTTKIKQATLSLADSFLSWLYAQDAAVK